MTSPAENPVPCLAKGHLHTAILIAIHDQLLARHPGAFFEEDDTYLVIPAANGQYIKIETSELAEAVLGVVPSQTQEGSARSVTDSQRLDWLEMQTVNVRTPLRYGSRDNFWASPDDSYEGEIGPSDLRAQIDAMLAAAPTLSGGALPVTVEDAPWIERAGEACPVEAATRVDLKLAGPCFADDPRTVFLNERADDWVWTSDAAPPILAWRLSGPSGGAGPDEARSAARTDVEPGCSTDDLPTPGEIRTINGQRCRFIEREIEGDKWEVLGPAPDAQQGEGAKPCHRDEALAALDWPRWSCPFGCPALFDPSPACPFHGDSTLEQALASAPSQQGEA